MLFSAEGLGLTLAEIAKTNDARSLVLQRKGCIMATAALVVECPVDPETLLSIRELRVLRLEILRMQLSDIDHVMNRLLIQGAIPFGDEELYREAVEHDLAVQCRLLEQRIESSETVYFDELELYYEIMSEA